MWNATVSWETRYLHSIGMETGLHAQIASKPAAKSMEESVGNRDLEEKI